MQPINVNLRYQLWKHHVPKQDWSKKLVQILGIEIARAELLLESDSPSKSELEVLARAWDIEIDALAFTPFDPDEVLNENLRYLINDLKHGGKAKLADTIGVSRITVSRWLNQKGKPNRSNLEQIAKYFDLDIVQIQEPLFLSLDPIGARAQKEWLNEQIDRLSIKTLNELFPALKRLLTKR